MVLGDSSGAAKVGRGAAAGLVPINPGPGNSDRESRPGPLKGPDLRRRLSRSPFRVPMKLSWTRNSRPAYALRGYVLRTVIYGFGHIPVERFDTKLADIEPGEQATAIIKPAEVRPVEVRLG